MSQRTINRITQPSEHNGCSVEKGIENTKIIFEKCCIMQCSISCDSHTNDSSYFHSGFTKYFFSSKVYRWILHPHNPKGFAQMQNWSQIKLKKPWQKKKCSEIRIKPTLDAVILELFLKFCLLMPTFLSLWKIYFYGAVYYMYIIFLPYLSFLAHLCSALLPLTSTVVQCTVEDFIN